jgi:hypothetical protein
MEQSSGPSDGVKPIFRWSFSQWESYSSCPARWKYRHRDKLPGKPPGPAAARGLRIHDEVEQYITGGRADPPAEVAKKYYPILDEFKNHENGDRYCEQMIVFDSEWAQCGRHDPQAALIMVLDALRFANDGVLHIGEWKSGRPKDTHGDQRKMYALGGLKKYKNPVEVRVTTYYLEDTAPPQQLVVKPTAEEKLVTLWTDRKALMERDEICAPRPGIHCRWCDYAASKGGPCRFQ